jgi:hypothetical protein
VKFPFGPPRKELAAKAIEHSWLVVDEQESVHWWIPVVPASGTGDASRAQGPRGA